MRDKLTDLPDWKNLHTHVNTHAVLHTLIDSLLAVENPPVNFLHDIINNATRSTAMGRLTLLVTIAHLFSPSSISTCNVPLKPQRVCPFHVNRLGGPQQRKRDGDVAKGQLDVKASAVISNQPFRSTRTQSTTAAGQTESQSAIILMQTPFLHLLNNTLSYFALMRGENCRTDRRRERERVREKGARARLKQAYHTSS